jgi:hypothetical protein
MFIFELGAKVKSGITGFEGIVTSRSENIYACNRYWVQPSVDKQGKKQDGMWLDEGEAVMLSKPKPVKKANRYSARFPNKAK